MDFNSNNIDELKEAYKKLLNDYNEYKTESDDICKEYESTIQVLTESLETLKLQNYNFNKENKILKENNKDLTEELNKVKLKNKDKMNDIELLNKEIDKLHNEYSEIKENKNILKNKMIDLENDNEKYLEKIRQYEFEIEDLKGKLEEKMEDLITTQTEFEEYKNKSEEEIQRYKEKLEDEKNNNDVLKKNKINNEVKKDDFDNNCYDDNNPKNRINRAYSVIIKNSFDNIINRMKKRKEEIIKFKQSIQKEITQFFF